MLVFLWPFCLFYGHFVYFMAIWYISLSLGIFSPVLECLTEKNLATLDLAVYAEWKVRKLVQIAPKNGDHT
jgi:hypothetical protein